MIRLGASTTIVNELNFFTNIKISKLILMMVIKFWDDIKRIHSKTVLV